jgi:predicted RNA-binding protein YlqC (UPF0109 family)
MICEISKKNSDMRTYYEISSEETGKVLLKRRKIAKALRLWLSEHGVSYRYIFFAG